MTPDAPTVLLIEDEPQMRRMVRAALTGDGYQVLEATTGAEGLQLARSRRPDVVLLDLGLPDGDGFGVLARLRAWSAVPVIVLSARGREDDKVAALDGGADDYLTKPFGMRELFARLRAALRHRGVEPAPVLEVGPLRIDRERHEVTLAGAPCHLTPIEYKLLLALAANLGAVLTHRQLIQAVWGPTPTDQSHTLRVHMASLRRKVEPTPARPRLLRTEVGVGYRLVDER